MEFLYVMTIINILMLLANVMMRVGIEEMLAESENPLAEGKDEEDGMSQTEPSK